MRNLRKGFVSISVIMISTFFVTVLIAMNNFNSQIKYSNERNLVEKQIYYSTYAGLQKGIFEITQNKDCSIGEYFGVGEDMTSISPQLQNHFGFLKVIHKKAGDVYTYTIESTGYGRFKESTLSQKITAKITVDYVEKNGIIRIDSIEIK